MANVADIVEGASVNGAVVELIYSKISETYAVYRTSLRVIIQYADDDGLGGEQRKALSGLNAAKGQINGLIDGWRSGVVEQQAKARAYDRRVADALICALQGDHAAACVLMDSVRADVEAERTSVARSQYIVVAAASVLVVALIAGVLSSPLTAVPDIYKMIWAASGFGALGAFFSIALAIRDRSVQTDLHARNNTIDAILRVLIGAISASVLYCLLKTDLIQLQLSGTTLIGKCTPQASCPLQGAAAQYFIMVLAFVAGFSERLVGDLLSGAKLVSASSAAPAVANPQAAAVAAAGGLNNAANEKNPRGLPAAALAQPPAAAPAQTAAAPADDDAEGCLTASPAGANEHTVDAELPEASGGIEKS